ncbi:MAG: GNAT family N-acetyltransferase [Pseudomonadota bacterium]
MTLSSAQIFACLYATWPAAEIKQSGAWTFRKTPGGGNRVNAATRIDDAKEVPEASLVMVRAGQPGLDQALAHAGYLKRDATLALALKVPNTPVPPPLVTTFLGWEPLEAHRRVWAEDGIGPDRVEVMSRAKVPKTSILGRLDDKPVGVGFVGAHKDVAMVHALSVLPSQRRKGLAKFMMQRAMVWAHAQKCDYLSVLVTEDNQPARALYTALGFQPVTSYHYRAEGET